MIPTVQEVYNAARSVLGDDQVSGGEVFTNTILQPKYQFAYSELFRAMQSAQNPRIIQETYYDVPINTSYLDPATAGIENLGEVISVEERGGVTAWAISNVVPGTAVCTVTSAATTLATGNQAIVYGVAGVSDDVNGAWTVTVNSTTSTRLNGCAATGTYTAATGVLSTSNEMFRNVSPVQHIEFTDQSPQSEFLVYSWEGDVFRFPPCSGVRQLRITYSLSGEAPTSTSARVRIDDCLGFLMYRIAGLAASSKGMTQRAQMYNALAVGPKWDVDNTSGGLLEQLLLSGIRNLQRLPPGLRQPPAFGGNRRRRWGVW